MTAPLRGELARSTALQRNMNHYLFVLMAQQAASAACGCYAANEHSHEALMHGGVGGSPQRKQIAADGVVCHRS